MQRDPAIHIRKSDLITIFNKVGIDSSIVDKIMYKAKEYNIQNRVNVTLSSNGKKKAARASVIDDKTVEMFNRIYDTFNKNNNLKILTVRKTDAHYITLKEITHQALTFCNLYDIENLTEGFKAYLSIGYELLKSKYSIYRLKGHGQRIMDYYGAIKIIKDDAYPDKTTEMYGAWKLAVIKYFGHSLDITDPQKYMYFVKAREDADQMKADYKDWIFAQFEKWSFLNSIPEFSQYSGEQAAINYSVYVKQTAKEFKSKEEQEYFNTISNEKEIPLKGVKRKKA